MRKLLLLIFCLFISVPVPVHASGQVEIYVCNHDYSMSKFSWLIVTGDRAILRVLDGGEEERGVAVYVQSILYRIRGRSARTLEMEACMEARRKRAVYADYSKGEEFNIKKGDDYALTPKDFVPVSRQDIVIARKLGDNLFFPDWRGLDEEPSLKISPTGLFLPAEKLKSNIFDSITFFMGWGVSDPIE